MDITYHLSDHTIDTPEGTISCAEVCRQLGIRMPDVVLTKAVQTGWGDIEDYKEVVLPLDEAYGSPGHYVVIWEAAYDLALSYGRHIGADKAIVTD